MSSRLAVRLQRLDMRVEQGVADVVRRVVGAEGASDIGVPRRLGAAAADILGNADAQLRIALITQDAAETGDARGGSPGPLRQLGDRERERRLGVVDEAPLRSCGIVPGI